MSFYAITSLYKATPVMRCVHRAAADEHGCMRVVEMKVKRVKLRRGRELHHQIHENTQKTMNRMVRST
jgi:hypothetical protein